MKKLHLLAFVAACGLSFGLCSCSSNVKNIGILEYVTQDALELCREGFVSTLKERGYEEGKNININYQNPEANASTQSTMASKLARESALLFGIATPSAVALKSALEDAGKSTPLLYSACTDPVGAGLITSLTSHANVTGTSDGGPTAKNIDLFTKFKDKNGNKITKVGILYSSGESNSIVQKNEMKAECDKLGLSMVDGGMADSTIISTTLSSLISQGIQGLFIPTDNSVAAAMSSISETILTNKILTVCADSSSTDAGGSIGYSVSYKTLGETTGAMAADILDGKDIATISPSYSSSFPLSINQSFFTNTGISLPSDIPTSVSMD
jgi:putative tryptophan/tyrosine transport system substrate-binding protein